MFGLSFVGTKTSCKIPTKLLSLNCLRMDRTMHRRASVVWAGTKVGINFRMGLPSLAFNGISFYCAHVLLPETDLFQPDAGSWFVNGLVQDVHLV